eukprot:Nk52_evm10s219 gene=Nk52_evmTU10s219
MRSTLGQRKNGIIAIALLHVILLLLTPNTYASSGGYLQILPVLTTGQGDLLFGCNDPGVVLPDAAAQEAPRVFCMGKRICVTEKSAGGGSFTEGVLNIHACTGVKDLMGTCGNSAGEESAVFCMAKRKCNSCNLAPVTSTSVIATPLSSTPSPTQTLILSDGAQQSASPCSDGFSSGVFCMGQKTVVPSSTSSFSPSATGTGSAETPQPTVSSCSGGFSSGVFCMGQKTAVPSSTGSLSPSETATEVPSTPESTPDATGPDCSGDYSSGVFCMSQKTMAPSSTGSFLPSETAAEASKTPQPTPDATGTPTNSIHPTSTGRGCSDTYSSGVFCMGQKTVSPSPSSTGSLPPQVSPGLTGSAIETAFPRSTGLSCSGDYSSGVFCMGQKTAVPSPTSSFSPSEIATPSSTTPPPIPGVTGPANTDSVMPTSTGSTCSGDYSSGVFCMGQKTLVPSSTGALSPSETASGGIACSGDYSSGVFCMGQKTLVPSSTGTPSPSETDVESSKAPRPTPTTSGSITSSLADVTGSATDPVPPTSTGPNCSGDYSSGVFCMGQKTLVPSSTGALSPSETDVQSSKAPRPTPTTSGSITSSLADVTGSATDPVPPTSTGPSCSGDYSSGVFCMGQKTLVPSSTGALSPSETASGGIASSLVYVTGSATDLVPPTSTWPSCSGDYSSGVFCMGQKTLVPSSTGALSPSETDVQSSKAPRPTPTTSGSITSSLADVTGSATDPVPPTSTGPSCSGDYSSGVFCMGQKTLVPSSTGTPTPSETDAESSKAPRPTPTTSGGITSSLADVTGSATDPVSPTSTGPICSGDYSAGVFCMEQKTAIPSSTGSPLPSQTVVDSVAESINPHSDGTITGLATATGFDSTSNVLHTMTGSESGAQPTATHADSVSDRSGSFTHTKSFGQPTPTGTIIMSNVETSIEDDVNTKQTSATIDILSSSSNGISTDSKTDGEPTATFVDPTGSLSVSNSIVFTVITDPPVPSGTMSPTLGESTAFTSEPPADTTPLLCNICICTALTEPDTYSATCFNASISLDEIWSKIDSSIWVLDLRARGMVNFTLPDKSKYEHGDALRQLQLNNNALSSVDVRGILDLFPRLLSLDVSNNDLVELVEDITNEIIRGNTSLSSYAFGGLNIYECCDMGWLLELFTGIAQGSITTEKTVTTDASGASCVSSNFVFSLLLLNLRDAGCSHPLEPVIEELEAISPSRIEILWTMPLDNLAEVTEYVLEMSTQIDVWNEVYRGEISRAVITQGVVGSTIHGFRVKALNEFGSSAYSATKTIQTPSDPPGPVRNIVISTITSSSFRVSWDAPVGGAANYEVFAREVSTGFERLVMKFGSAVTAEASNFDFDTEYLVEVVAFNTDGVPGDVQVSNSFKTLLNLAPRPGVPVISAIDSTTATMAWSFGSTHLLPDAFGSVSFFIRVRERGVTEWTYLKSTLLQLDLTGLNVFTQYQASVLCSNEAGNSTWSKSINFRTATSLPGVVSSVTVGAITDTSAVVTWTSPVDNGGSRIVMYKVEVTDIESGENWGRLFSPQTSLKLSSLAGSNRYRVDISARNDNGFGQAESGSVFSTLSPAPVVVSVVANDPDDQNTVFDLGDTIRITFDVDTNQDAMIVQNPSGFINWNLNVGDYSLEWTDARNLLMTFQSTTQAMSRRAIGRLTGRIRAGNGIKRADGSSQELVGKFPSLTGDWGIFSGTNVLKIENVFAQKETTINEDETLEFALVSIIDLPDLLDGSFELIASNVDGEIRIGSNIVSDSNGDATVTATSSNQLFNRTPKLTFTPQSNFNGVTAVQFSLIRSGVDIGLAVLLVKVTAVNDPPSVEAPRTGDAFFETFTVIPGLSASDVDISASGDLVEGEDQGELTVRITGPLGSSDVDFVSVTGPLDEINAALSSLMYRPSIEVKQRDNVVMIMAVDESQALSGIKEIQFSPSCSQMSAPTVVGGKLSDNMLYVDLIFSSKVEFVKRRKPNCAELFDSQSVLSFGKSPRCVFVNGKTELRVFLSNGATIAGGSSVTMLGGELAQCTEGVNTLSGSFEIEEPDNPIVPEVALRGPSKVSLCASPRFHANVQKLSGRGGTFQWASDDSKILSNLDLTTRQLRIPSRQLEAGKNYKLIFTARNFLGVASAPTEISFSKAALPIPEIRIRGRKNRRIWRNRRRKYFNIRTKVALSSCVRKKSNLLKYQWTVTPSIPLDPKFVNRKRLRVPRELIDPDIEYIFTVTATMTADATLTNSASASVRLRPRRLRVVIQGGHSRTIPFWKPYTLDASESYDPDGVTSQEEVFTWSCKTKSGEKCYDRGTLLEKVWPSTKKVTIPANGLYAVKSNVFLITCTFKKGSRTRSKTVRLKITNSDPPQVAIKTPRDEVVFGVNDKVTLQGKILDRGSLKGKLNYLWTETTGRLDLTDTAIAKSHEKHNLHLNHDGKGNKAASIFSPGTSYTFELVVYDSAKVQNGTAEYTVSINGPPTSGTFTASPSSIEAGQVVTLNALNWEDPDGQAGEALEYQFFYRKVKKNTKLVAISKRTGEPTFSYENFPVGDARADNTLTLVLRVYDATDDYAEVETSIQVAPLSAAETKNKAKEFLDKGIASKKDTGDSSGTADGLKSVSQNIASSSMSKKDKNDLHRRITQELKKVVDELDDDDKFETLESTLDATDDDDDDDDNNNNNDDDDDDDDIINDNVGMLDSMVKGGKDGGNMLLNHNRNVMSSCNKLLKKSKKKQKKKVAAAAALRARRATPQLLPVVASQYPNMKILISSIQSNLDTVITNNINAAGETYVFDEQNFNAFAARELALTFPTQEYTDTAGRYSSFAIPAASFNGFGFSDTSTVDFKRLVSTNIIFDDPIPTGYTITASSFYDYGLVYTSSSDLASPLSVILGLNTATCSASAGTCAPECHIFDYVNNVWTKTGITTTVDAANNRVTCGLSKKAATVGVFGKTVTPTVATTSSSSLSTAVATTTTVINRNIVNVETTSSATSSSSAVTTVASSSASSIPSGNVVLPNAVAAEVVTVNFPGVSAADFWTGPQNYASKFKQSIVDVLNGANVNAKDDRVAYTTSDIVIYKLTELPNGSLDVLFYVKSISSTSSAVPATTLISAVNSSKAQIEAAVGLPLQSVESTPVTPTPEDSDDGGGGGGSPMIAIAAGVGGGVVLLIACGGIFYWVRKKRKVIAQEEPQEKPQEKAQEMQGNPEMKDADGLDELDVVEGFNEPDVEITEYSPCEDGSLRKYKSKEKIVGIEEGLPEKHSIEDDNIEVKEVLQKDEDICSEKCPVQENTVVTTPNALGSVIGNEPVEQESASVMIQVDNDETVEQQENYENFTDDPIMDEHPYQVVDEETANETSESVSPRASRKSSVLAIDDTNNDALLSVKGDANADVISMSNIDQEDIHTVIALKEEVEPELILPRVSEMSTLADVLRAKREFMNKWREDKKKRVVKVERRGSHNAFASLTTHDSSANEGSSSSTRAKKRKT